MSVAVGLGLMQFPFAGADDYWRWADMCEAGGVDSLWQTDRLLSREPMLECMAAMAALAGRTRRVKFGMNVVSLALRDPVLTAKQCATIDVLSNGRLLPAFGIGSPQAPEWKALAIDTSTRGRRTDEGLEIVRRLWVEDSVDFDGVHYRLSGATISPKPVQADLPMWIGGGSQAAIERTARIGTGWQGGPETPPEAGRVVAAIRAALTKTGRSIDDDHYGASFPFYFGRPDDRVVQGALEAYRKRTGRAADAYFAVGGSDVILERISAYIGAGISKFVLRPIGADGETVLAQTQRLIDQVLPEVARRWPKAAQKPAQKPTQKPATKPAA
jgi:probable F420-dependent oxidoreductase